MFVENVFNVRINYIIRLFYDFFYFIRVIDMNYLRGIIFFYMSIFCVVYIDVFIKLKYCEWDIIYM